MEGRNRSLRGGTEAVTRSRTLLSMRTARNGRVLLHRNFVTGVAPRLTHSAMKGTCRLTQVSTRTNLGAVKLSGYRLRPKMATRSINSGSGAPQLSDLSSSSRRCSSGCPRAAAQRTTTSGLRTTGTRAGLSPRRSTSRWGPSWRWPTGWTRRRRSTASWRRRTAALPRGSACGASRATGRITRTSAWWRSAPAAAARAPSCPCSATGRTGGRCWTTGAAGRGRRSSGTSTRLRRGARRPCRSTALGTMTRAASSTTRVSRRRLWPRSQPARGSSSRSSTRAGTEST
mmetsp:Transcript_7700/g.18434  ORF Transcript_7700/g.18434 Transcript_7700/m.18434 type:complete len:287 (+) Transcript_7700:759-1619(+)